MSNAYFFLASLTWNFGLGMTWLAVPLYAHSQGLSNAEIGALFALPVLAQAPLNLVGGAYTDRIGGRRIVTWSCAAMALSGLWFIFVQGFWMLIFGQFVLVLARAVFWPANWSMAAELPGAGGGVQLGRLNAVTNVGQISGTALSGFLLVAAGFGLTFAALAAVGAAALLASLGTKAGKPRRSESTGNILDAYRPLLRQPLILYAIVCAYLSALPFSLGTSFIPLLLAQYQHSEDTSGVLVSLRAVGSIAAGLLAGRFVRGGPDTLWPIVCGLAVASAVGLLPTINHPVPIALWMLIVGLGSGAMTLYFQITIAEHTPRNLRGSALALGGLGWSLSHFSTPLAMGFLANRYGIAEGFYALGFFSFACVLALVVMRRWAFADTR